MAAAPAGGEGSVEPRDQPLRRGLFIARGAVDLSGQEQARQPLRLQGRIELARIDVIIFDGVARPDHPHALQARDGLQDGELDFLRQRGRDAVRIDRGIVEPFRLQEDLVPVAVAEADDLVLDRGAIARPACF